MPQSDNVDLKQHVSNSYPSAAVVFILLDKTGAPIADPKYVIQPDIDDVISVSTTLGSTGNMGTFVVTINNTNNKYFYKDDLTAEIKKLNTISNVSAKGINTQISPNQVTNYSKTTWNSAQQFLNAREFNRVYRPTNISGIDVGYFLYYEGKNLVYRPLSQADIANLTLATPTKADYSADIRVGSLAELGPTESLGDPEDATSAAHGIVYNQSKQNAEFFETYGGQLDQGRCYFKPMQLCRIFMTKGGGA